MYKRTIQEPTYTTTDRGEAKVEHPAFAMIGASRVSGGTYLYGSDFQHQHFVRITVRKSYLKRNLSTDWPHGFNELIELDLSEAQWAEFVSAMNIGFGTQCTLRHLNGEFMPELPRPERRVDQFGDEAKEKLAGALQELEALKAEISELKASEKQKSTLRARVDTAVSRLTSGLPFVAKLFAEHMETTVQKAKTEINAYGTHMLVKTGLAALAKEQAQQGILTYDQEQSK